MSFVYRVAFSENELRKDLPLYARAESITMIILANFAEESGEDINSWNCIQRQQIIQSLTTNIYIQILKLKQTLEMQRQY